MCHPGQLDSRLRCPLIERDCYRKEASNALQQSVLDTLGTNFVHKIYLLNACDGFAGIFKVHECYAGWCAVQDDFKLDFTRDVMQVDVTNVWPEAGCAGNRFQLIQ